ncbi:MAG: proteasome subunit alpha [Nitrospiria bacterium]
MFEEPYRWIEAVRNRREYLEEQLASGSPIIALPCQNGIVLTTLGSGASKLYEVYDQIAFGGLGHPTDLEKLRTTVLEIAHIEGFNRSPSDVNLQRLIKFGIAPVVKQAFEEVLHAPFIARLLFTEISIPSGRPMFLRLDYDGMFEESEAFGVLAPTRKMGDQMEKFLETQGATASLPLNQAVQIALRAWAISLIPPSSSETRSEERPEISLLDALLKEKLGKSTVEIVLLDKQQPGTSKYRALSKRENESFLREWIK